jgi:hypothetical protein
MIDLLLLASTIALTYLYACLRLALYLHER